MKLMTTEIIIYYDGPQVVVAEDENKQLYINTLYEINSLGDFLYLTAKTTEENLEEFKTGKVDLRSLYKAPYYVSTDEFGDVFNAREIKESEVKSSMLPDKNFYLNR